MFPSVMSSCRWLVFVSLLVSLQPACSESGLSLTSSVLELLTENSLSGKSVWNRDSFSSQGDVLANLFEFSVSPPVVWDHKPAACAQRRQEPLR